MKNTSLSRLAFGIGFTVVGVAALLGAFDIINFWEIFRTYWPLGLIAIALVLLVENLRQNYFWAIILLTIGVAAQLNLLGIIDVGFWQLFLPLIAIAIGLSILFQRAHITTSSDSSLTAIMSESNTKNESKDYRGDKVTAVMGSCVIDLRKARIKKEATIEVFSLMGGIAIRVPDGWTVKTSLTPIMAGVDNKTPSSKKDKLPVLNIVGTIVMGGIEIKD